MSTCMQRPRYPGTHVGTYIKPSDLPCSRYGHRQEQRVSVSALRHNPGAPTWPGTQRSRTENVQRHTTFLEAAPAPARTESLRFGISPCFQESSRQPRTVSHCFGHSVRTTEHLRSYTRRTFLDRSSYTGENRESSFRHFTML